MERGDLLYGYSKDKITMGLISYINNLLIASALFLTPSLLLITNVEINKSVSPYAVIPFLLLFFGILVFFTTIIMALVTIKNLAILNMEKKFRKDFNYKTFKLYNRTKLFFKIGINAFGTTFPFFMSHITVNLLSINYSLVIYYIISIPFLIFVKITIDESMLDLVDLNKAFYEKN